MTAFHFCGNLKQINSLRHNIWILLQNEICLGGKNISGVTAAPVIIRAEELLGQIM